MSLQCEHNPTQLQCCTVSAVPPCGGLKFIHTNSVKQETTLSKVCICAQLVASHAAAAAAAPVSIAFQGNTRER